MTPHELLAAFLRAHDHSVQPYPNVVAEARAALATTCSAHTMTTDEQIAALTQALTRCITSHCSNEKLFCGSCTPARTLLAELGAPIPPRTLTDEQRVPFATNPSVMQHGPTIRIRDDDDTPH